MKYLYGYKTSKRKKLIRIARVYSKQEHNIEKTHIDVHTLKIINTLTKKGHSAYVVGGAIRDLLLHKAPKDFDVVTDAHPREIKRYFKRAQIVGKRFPIVIVPISYNHYVEISTFRSHESALYKDDGDHTLEGSQFGTIQEDVTRRDFTCNALYYSLQKEEIIDFVGGFTHIIHKKLVPVRTKFKEDPIRLLRAIKYASKGNLSIPLALKCQLYINTPLLQTVASSRMSDEIMKILLSGCSRQIIERCVTYRLLCYMLPVVYTWYTKRPKEYAILLENLAQADKNVAQKKSRIYGISMLIKSFVLVVSKELLHTNTKKKELHKKDVYDVIAQVKQWIYPMTPPNSEVYSAVESILASEKLFKSKFPSHVPTKRSRYRSKSRNTS